MSSCSSVEAWLFSSPPCPSDDERVVVVVVGDEEWIRLASATLFSL